MRPCQISQGECCPLSNVALLQVFGLLDMHDQVDAQMGLLTELLARTNSGNLLRVSQRSSHTSPYSSQDT